jgi:hypothetical protein
VDAVEELEVVDDVLMEEGLIDVLDVVFTDVPDEVLDDVPDEILDDVPSEVPKDVPRVDFEDVFAELAGLVEVIVVPVEDFPLDRF